jgi:phosphoenolpyruvate carboxylase
MATITRAGRAGPTVRREDVPLHNDVRWLAAALGRVIRRLEGDAAFGTVETLRRACRARRHGDPNAQSLDQLLAQIDALPIEHIAVTARAFTLFFLLINTAEQVHRVRRARAYHEVENAQPQPGSARAAMRQLRAEGRNATDVERALLKLDVRPVLTAHPTESTRRTLLQLQARVADLLLDDRDDEKLDAEVELLWLTAEVRQDRPSVKDEVSTVLWYLETRLLDAGEDARHELIHAFEEEFGQSQNVRQIVPLTLGNWVGGDRDGNPYVTPDITIATARRASYAILARYAGALRDLIERISVSSTLAAPPAELLASLEHDRDLLPAIYEANASRNADEPLRLKLSFMVARIEATRRLTAARDAGKTATEPAAYTSVTQFEDDLNLVRDTLLKAGATHTTHVALDPLLASVKAHGFHGYLMDVRDQAKSDGVLEQLKAMQLIQREIGERAASTYVVSMTSEAEDLLRVLRVARDIGLETIDIVPLFETLNDLERAPDVMRALLADPDYQRHLQARGNLQEVMIGYSDSGKDAGILASSWALYETQEKLAEVFRHAQINLRFFHGRGGSVGRGGGSPVARALAALPPNTVYGRIKITEQGEIVSQQFGLLPVAERTLEVTLAGTLLQEFNRSDAAAPDEFRDVMSDLAARSLNVYRDLVHGHKELFDLFRAVTPIDELADARFGSRPAYRPGASKGIQGIRAIPWQFGWTQIRLMLPGWLGVGTALSHHNVDTLRRMAQTWPFFDDLLAKIEMVCAKADLEIARAYVQQLGGDIALFDRLDHEFNITVETILNIRESDVLLRDNVVLQSAIALRNPYVDPLSLIQIALLKRKRQHANEQVDAILATTLSGVAQGLRNTG